MTAPTSKLRSFQLFVRKVATLALPYFRSEEKWKARALLTAIVVLNLGAVYMLVLINDWNRVFYDALQNKDAKVFWHELGRFTYLAFGFIVIAVYRFYLTQLLQMRWRAWMTAHYLDRWLAHKAFYHLELARFSKLDGAIPDNPDQRISEDVNQFTSYSVTLTMAAEAMTEYRTAKLSSEPSSRVGRTTGVLLRMRSAMVVVSAAGDGE